MGVTHFRAYMARAISQRVCLERMYTQLNHAFQTACRSTLRYAAISVWAATDAKSRQWHPYPLVRGHGRSPRREAHRCAKQARVA